MQRVILRRSAVTNLVKSWRKGVSSTSASLNEDTVSSDERSDILDTSPRKFREVAHPTLDRMIRVNQAGERAAVMIYAGQLAVLGKADDDKSIQHMEEQEEGHVEAFERLIVDRRVRPSLLLPLWELAGFALGAGTAMLGKAAAMACTVAVEDTIEHHYNNQLRELLADHHEEEDLLEVISNCRDEELEHKQTGLDHNAEEATAYEALTKVISVGCRTAIWIAERI